jgi:hypothetical protein
MFWVFLGFYFVNIACVVFLVRKDLVIPACLLLAFEASLVIALRLLNIF